MLLDTQGDMNAIKNTMNELEKLSDEEKAEEYLMKNMEERQYGDGYFIEPLKTIKQAYLDGLAEGRNESEKENAELKAHCKAVDEVNEKMKCCGNCKKRGSQCVAEEMQGILCGKEKRKWELAE